MPHLTWPILSFYWKSDLWAKFVGITYFELVQMGFLFVEKFKARSIWQINGSGETQGYCPQRHYERKDLEAVSASMQMGKIFNFCYCLWEPTCFILCCYLGRVAIFQGLLIFVHIISWKYWSFRHLHTSFKTQFWS